MSGAVAMLLRPLLALARLTTSATFQRKALRIGI